MGKFLRQIILVTRKNLRVRFSHRCLTFCELFIPLFITASVGFLISANTAEHHGGRLSSSYDLEDEPVDDAASNTVEELYNCTSSDDDDKFWDDDPYQCQIRHDFINNKSGMQDVKQLHVHYVLGENIIGEEQHQLVEAVMTSSLGSNQKNESAKRNSTINWMRSWMSEKEMELCVIQHHDLCNNIFAAVVITKIVDAVEQERKFTIKYKIRLTDEDNEIWTFWTNRLYIDFNHYLFRDMLEKTRKVYFRDEDQRYSWFHPSQRSKGFIFIQTFLDQGITNYIKNKYGQKNFEEVQISLVRMPYIQPPGERAADVSRFASLLYSLLISLTIFSLMRVNSEKCSGFKELLRMHGVTIWTQWMGWLFSSFIVYSIWTLVLTLLLCAPIAFGPNLLPLMDVNCILYWVLLILFAMSITTFSYLVSVFFDRVWTAASVGLVVWIMLAVFMMVSSAAFSTIRKWTAIVLMLIPPVAFDFTMRFFISGGGRFRTMGVPIFENIQLTTLHCLFMLLLDSFIYMTLAIYLDNVLPSKYGVRKPPLYFLRDLRKSFGRIVKGSDYQEKHDEDDFSQGSVEMTSIISQELNQPFQSDPEHLEAAIVIHNLKKQFIRNRKRAVDGLSAKMFTGEIYALLGFNGAGKTTTIGVLTGLHSPTDGVARIFDFDIRKDMEEIRKYVGLCPQHNLLYDEMSVLEQVTFFGSLKGVEEPGKKAEELLAWLGLSEKLHEKPGKLSGGQKRRVHLGIALIGDTKLAFLDEPTSGLDPETRRGVWDILSTLRGKVTVILTTHDMEEADVLGDRIGIMSEGKMICSGTPSFLKKYYGVGYNLKMSSTSANCNPEKVHSLSREYVPNAKLNSQSSGLTSSTGPLDSISISLPTADLDLLKVADLMDALQNQKEQLCIDDIGLSLSTMDEVFLKVGEAVHAVTVPISSDPSTNHVSGSRYVGSRLRWYRFTSLVSKRMLYFSSAPFTLILMILFFAAILWVSLTLLSHAVNRNLTADPPRVVSSSSLSSYHSPFIILHDNEKLNMESVSNNVSFAVSYLHQLHTTTTDEDGLVKVKEFPNDATFDSIMRNLQKHSIDDIHNYRQSFVGGASFNMSENQRNITGFYSVYALHSAPLSVNLISQTLIKKTLGVDASISVVNHPFKKGRSYEHISPHTVARTNLKMYYFVKCGGVMLLVVITSLLTGTAALLPTEERLNKGKQLQLMTTSPFLYWLSMFTWDFLFFSFINIVITLIYFLADYSSGNWIFTNNGAGFLIFLILELHSFAALWFCYLVSWAPCIKTASDGFLIINKLAIIVGVLWNIISHLLLSWTYYEVRVRVHGDLFPKIIYYGIQASGYVSWIVPMYSLFLSMFKLATVSIPNSICNWFPQDVLDLSCEAEVSESTPISFMQSCCENCKENCFKPVSYFNTSGIVLHDDHETHSMIFDILALLLSGIVNAGLLFTLEYFIPYKNAERHLENMTSSNLRINNVLTSNACDEDVANEAARVGDIVKDNALETANHALIAHNLHISFGELKAVNGLSFGVYRGECFGLLGVNGAGKTTAFRILTGDIFPSRGYAYSGGMNLYMQRDSYLSSIGYCPQFDGIISSLTGLQMVKLYGALRGIPPDRLAEDATIWLDKFGLLGSASKKCGKYSGGMKRRLSAAIALIGNPKMLLLDEPTTGVDPAFRRQFWNVIREVRESGQSVLLTSHTMDECEALCTRLGIMVDGQFKCLGNIQHLKSKFGRGYILTMKLKRVREEDESERKEKVDMLLEKVQEAFGRCRLQTKQKALIQYQILNKSLWYGEIFRTMEEIRNLPELSEVVEEYSVTETSLEDVFISFANKTGRT